MNAEVTLAKVYSLTKEAEAAEEAIVAVKEVEAAPTTTTNVARLKKPSNQEIQ